MQWNTDQMLNMVIAQTQNQGFQRQMPDEYEKFKALETVISQFSMNHWQQAIAVYNQGAYKGQEALLGGVLYQQLGMAGRLRITLHLGDESVSMLGDIEGDRCGLDLINGTFDSAIKMVELVDQYWDNNLFTDNPRLTTW